MSVHQFLERGELATRHRLAHLPHEAQVEGEVVQGQEPVAEELARGEEMAQVRAREAAAGLAGARGVERCAVVIFNCNREWSRLLGFLYRIRRKPVYTPKAPHARSSR